MVTVSRNPKSSESYAGGVFVPRRYIVLIVLALVFLSFQHLKDVLHHRYESGGTLVKAPGGYRESKPILRNPKAHEQCRFYLAESAVAPGAGLGIFTAVGLLKGDAVAFPDICIFVSDAPERWTHLRGHSFGFGTYFGQFEGSNSRAACEGVTTQVNTVPVSHVNSRIKSPIQPTTAGVRRHMPGAGSITHHYGIYAETVDTVSAGSEITIDYGDWEFDSDKPIAARPRREPDWLANHGWCIDNLEILISTIAGAGRGAFVKRPLEAGDVIAPAPLQVFRNRKIFEKTRPAQLFLNYCFQPKGSQMIFYPYGAGVNLINHSKRPNAYLRWSPHPFHRQELFDMEHEQFWKEVNPGSLILEVVASRKLLPGEEVFIDYGDAWDREWKDHVAHWTPPDGSGTYSYPEDMDETEVLRTVKEQETDPYPTNLHTMCLTPTWDRKENHIEWYESEKTDKDWEEMWKFVYCNILDRKMGADGSHEYTVSLIFFNDEDMSVKPEDFVHDPSTPLEDLYIDFKTPRRAIRWNEKPYQDDEHIPNAFRSPLELPAHLFETKWDGS